MTRASLLWSVALLSLACLVAEFLLLVHDPRGVAFDRRSFGRLGGLAPASLEAAGQRTLRTIDVATVALALVAFALLALVRGQVRRAAVAAVLVVAPPASAEVLKRVLPFPPDRPPTFPSGHTATALSLGLALVVAVPPILRVTAALAGAAYGAAIGFSVVILGWHFPSDAVGSFFLCGVWASLLALALGNVPTRAAVSTRGALLGVGVSVAAVAVAAAIANRHPVAVASVRSTPAVVAAGVLFSLLSVALFSVITPLVGERVDYRGGGRS
jgi:membrane-associated phospholipid phosphatase